MPGIRDKSLLLFNIRFNWFHSPTEEKENKLCADLAMY
jgi:hypothetical protein